MTITISQKQDVSILTVMLHCTVYIQCSDWLFVVKDERHHVVNPCPVGIRTIYNTIPCRTIRSNTNWSTAELAGYFIRISVREWIACLRTERVLSLHRWPMLCMVWYGMTSLISWVTNKIKQSIHNTDTSDQWATIAFRTQWLTAKSSAVMGDDDKSKMLTIAWKIEDYVKRENDDSLHIVDRAT